MNRNTGDILHIDLTSGITRRETITDDFTGKFIGGNGFAAKLIFDRVPAGVAPFAEENGLAIAVGPLTDTPLWGTGRTHMAFISPQTGLFCDSNFGGDFGIAQKRTGIDAILVQGKASTPIYLLITETAVEFRDASHVWGKSTEATIAVLQEECGKGFVCMAIGPAGEHKIPFANVVSGGRRLGTAGRGGQGAVMGSKNLKAIVIGGGTRKNPVADRDGLMAFLREKLPELKKNKGIMTRFGTGYLPGFINGKGIIGTRNNSRELFDGSMDLSADLFFSKYGKGSTSCHGCALACGKNVVVDEGRYAGQTVKMPEYESIYAMGSMLENRDITSVFNGGHACDLAGMDTITFGVTMAFVAECLEKGIVSEKELGGRIDFAEAGDIAELVDMTVREEKIGRFMAMGSRRLSELWGGISGRFLHEVKGLEIAGHSPRGIRELSLGYAVSTRGGSHHDARPFYPGTHPDPGFSTCPEYVVKSNHFTSIGDSLVICRFIEEGILGPVAIGENMARAVNLITGWGVDPAKLEQCGERIYNLERLINCRRGVARKDDTLPWRVMHEPIPAGPSAGRFCPPETLSELLDRYYQLRGWDENGVPTPARLRELDLQQP